MIKVTAAIIEQDGRILIARRKKGEHLEGKWEFPGGKIEENETPGQCLKRELLEEFGIQTIVKDFICSSKYSYNHISIELLAYQVQYISGDFSMTDHDKIEWINPADYSKYNFAEADIPIIKNINKCRNSI